MFSLALLIALTGADVAYLFMVAPSLQPPVCYPADVSPPAYENQSRICLIRHVCFALMRHNLLGIRSLKKNVSHISSNSLKVLH